MLSFRTILPNTLELLKQLSQQPEFKPMRLVGGTALALQLGHRQSIDLDFFSTSPIDQDKIISIFRQMGTCVINNQTKNILQVDLNGIKVDVVDYSQYDWIDEPIYEEGLSLASAKDIAAMKINAIIGRGTRKDFVDLYVLLQHWSLKEIMTFYHTKYPDYSEYRALLSLTYFDDADQQSMPIMFIPDKWEDMKLTIIDNVKQYQQ
ncbi:MAG: nucleotidyl transferase AbiEii/AbiGii toxin family protein [Bacteroidales bacterium]|nr:nucleotidyl transferase AbiEii/AbiGii toxin family protein [Candidatus Colicola equi]